VDRQFLNAVRDEAMETTTRDPAVRERDATNVLPPVPATWARVLASEIAEPWFAELGAWIADERLRHTVFPPAADVFRALEATPYEEVRVVILGQDPYHDEGQAHGLSFSVPRGIKPPPSLTNIFKELAADVGARAPDHGCLEAWARRGVLLLNTVLTVRAHTPASHKGRGWERLTSAVLRKLSDRQEPVVFVLWGAHAQKRSALVDTTRHTVLQGAHPSPLSANKGFFGSRPFSSVNEALRRADLAPIDWQLPP
jgi:uracil-DNA glycosylase